MIDHFFSRGPKKWLVEFLIRDLEPLNFTKHFLQNSVSLDVISALYTKRTTLKMSAVQVINSPTSTGKKTNCCEKLCCAGCLCCTTGIVCIGGLVVGALALCLAGIWFIHLGVGIAAVVQSSGDELVMATEMGVYIYRTFAIVTVAEINKASKAK